MNNFPTQPLSPILTPQEASSPESDSTVPSTQECPVRQPSEITIPLIRKDTAVLHSHTATLVTSRNISRPSAGSSLVPITDAVNHALKGLKEAGLDAQQWQGLGLILGVPYEIIKIIDKNPALSNTESKLSELLTYADTSGLLLPERLVQAVSELIGSVLHQKYSNNYSDNFRILDAEKYITSIKEEIVTKAQSYFACRDNSLKLDCYHKDNLTWSDSISPRDAYLIFNTQLSSEDLYSLAARLNLPDADREALLPLTGQWNVYFAEFLWRADQQKLLTFGNLCAVIDESGHRWAVEVHACPKLGLDYDQLPDYKSGRALSENQSNKLDRLLSMRDLVSVFCDQMYISAEYLAQISGYSELLKHPLMQKSYQNCVKTMFLLELIFQQNRQKSKDGLSVNDVVQILNKPEVNEVNVAKQLVDRMTSGGAGNANSVFTPSQMATLAQRLPSVPDFEVVALAKALGIPDYKIDEIIRLDHLEADDQHEENTFQIINAAKNLGKLTPKNLVYALNQTCPLSFVNEVCNSNKFPQLQSVIGAQLPILALGQQDEDFREPYSMPLTMAFLGNLPLSHNLQRIGMSMGLTFDELKELQTHTNDNRQLLAYRLSKKLTETERGLETGHLYQALQFLGDESALAFFPKQQAGGPVRSLPEQTAKDIEQGKAYISAIRQIPAGSDGANSLASIACKIGLTRKKFNAIPVSCDPGWNFIQYLREAGEAPSLQRIKELVEWSGQLRQAKNLLDKSEANESALYFCPISRSLIIWPIGIDKKQSQGGPLTVYFEHDHLFKWVNEHHTHPLTREVLDAGQIRTDCPEFFEQLTSTLDGQSYDNPTHHAKENSS